MNQAEWNAMTQRFSSESESAFEEKCFKAWMIAVDTKIAAKCAGLTSADLPDYCYRDAYDDGASVAEAAKAAIKAAKEF